MHIFTSSPLNILSIHLLEIVSPNLFNSIILEQNPPIQETIDAGLTPLLIELSSHPDNDIQVRIQDITYFQRFESIEERKTGF